VITQANRTRSAADAKINSVSRAYELVMPEEFGHLRSRNYKHHDLVNAIRDMKSMPAGQGVKVKCYGTAREGGKKQKAAIAIANRERVPVRTMLRDGWLFIEKLKER
jgi:hypothetical protein